MYTSSLTPFLNAGVACATRRPNARRTSFRVACSAAPERVDRRGVMLGLAGAVLAAPLSAAQPAAAEYDIPTVRKTVPVSALTVFQKQDIVNELQGRAVTEFLKVLSPEDAPAARRLLLHDAMGYDAATGTGGVDGSVVLPEELNRPENKDLKPLVEKLAKAKAVIDAKNTSRGQAPLTWADTIVLAAKAATKEEWRQLKIARSPNDPAGATIIAERFGTPIVVRLGRLDATTPAPAGRVLPADATVAQTKEYFLKLGAQPGEKQGFLARKPLFWERVSFVLATSAAPDPAAAEAAFAAADPDYASWKVSYDRSRSTVTRTDYEVDFVDFLNRAADLGATFDKNRYYYDQELLVPAKL